MKQFMKDVVEEARAQGGPFDFGGEALARYLYRGRNGHNGGRPPVS